MNNLEISPEQQKIVNEFIFDLAMIDGPDDMFPPDNQCGDNEPRNPIAPSDTDCQSLVFAPVYDFVSYRKTRLESMQRSIGVLILI